jgi:hypothetical protein
MTWRAQDSRTFVAVGVNHESLGEVLYNNILVTATGPLTGALITLPVLGSRA